MTAIKAIRGKIPPKLMTVLCFTVLKFLPLLFLVLALMRSTLMSSGDSPTVVPFETATLLAMVFVAFLSPNLFYELPDVIRIGALYGLSAIPGIPTLLGGLIWPRTKTLTVILIPLSYLIDLVLAVAMNGPVAAILDAVMLALSILVMILDWESGKAK